MNPILSSAISSLIPSEISFKTEHKTPLSLRVIQIISGVGSIAATATMIYGIVSNGLAMIVLGAILMISSVTNFYLTHRIQLLQTLQEDTAKLQALNIDIQTKDQEIQRLSKDLASITQKLNQQNKDTDRLFQMETTKEKQLTDQLQKTADQLLQSETNAKTEMERLQKNLDIQTKSMKDLSEKDQKIIADLNANIDQLKSQNKILQDSVSSIQTEASKYQSQLDRYSKLNAELSEQIKSLSSATSSTKVDISDIIAHGAAIDQALAKQKAVAAKTALTTERIQKLLDAQNKRSAEAKG